MTTRWRNIEEGKLQTPEDLEFSISQELADLGMLEQGMTFQDKRDLLSAIRLSQRSAKVEEEERNKTWTPGSLSNHSHFLNSSSSKELNEECLLEERKGTEIDDHSGVNENSISNVLDDSKEELNSEIEPPPPILDYFGNENASVSDATSQFQVTFSCGNSVNLTSVLKSEDHKLESVSCETTMSQTICENEKPAEPNQFQGSDSENKLDDFSSPIVKQKDLNNLKRKKDDKERNIDVFSNSNMSDNIFLRRNVNEFQNRIPFYFVPKGTSLNKYIAYFKCYVNQYYKNLAVIQRNNIEHLEWGAPITMDMSSGFTGYRSTGLDAHGDGASKRYNFRDRFPKPKVIDFTSENSDDGEEESNDEDIFTPHNKKFPGIKLSTKRKNTSTADTLLTKKEKKENSQRKVLEDGESQDEDDHDGNNSSDPFDKISGKNKGSISRKRVRKIKSKLFHSSNEALDSICEMVPNVGVSSIIEPDIVIAEGPSILDTQPQLDDITNQPAPLSVKQRRLQLRAKFNGRRKKSEPRKNTDVVIEEDITHSLEESVETVNCPICWQLFPVCDIEEHASECNQYNPDNSSLKALT